MDWSLFACARHGHVTYAPDEGALAERLRADGPAGESWRCLRCWDFIPGAAQASGPAEDAPIVLRGRALRDALILRILAVERALRALVFGALAYAVIRFEHSQASIQRLFDRALPNARPLARVFNYDLDNSPTVAHLRHLINSKPHTIHLILAFFIGYAIVEAVEAVGLWSLKRWGEYVAVVATSAFLPIEIYELSHKVSVLKVVAFVINVALVVYLLVTKRLFGVRGGRAAYDAERHSESLLEVEAAAAAPARGSSEEPVRG